MKSLTFVAQKPFPNNFCCFCQNIIPLPRGASPNQIFVPGMKCYLGFLMRIIQPFFLHLFVYYLCIFLLLALHQCDYALVKHKIGGHCDIYYTAAFFFEHIA